MHSHYLELERTGSCEEPLLITFLRIQRTKDIYYIINRYINLNILSMSSQPKARYWKLFFLNQYLSEIKTNPISVWRVLSDWFLSDIQFRYSFWQKIFIFIYFLHDSMFFFWKCLELMQIIRAWKCCLSKQCFHFF